MEDSQIKIEPETATKIIGKGEKTIYFSSLADALRAFLEGEVSTLLISEDTASFSFSSHGVTIKKQTRRDVSEQFVGAPMVSLKFFRLSGKPFDCSIVWLMEEFKDFFKKRIQDMQIYEQVCHNPDSVGPKLYTNYMINLSWNEERPDNIILTLHNIDVKDNHWWRGDFRCQKSGEDGFHLVPISPLINPVHKITASFSKN